MLESYVGGYILASAIFPIYNYFCLPTIINPLFFLFIAYPLSGGNETLRDRAKEEYLKKLTELICPAWLVGIAIPSYTASGAFARGEFVAFGFVLFLTVGLPFFYHSFLLAVKWRNMLKECRTPSEFNPVDSHDDIL